jgi:hypothetical protein
VPVQVRAASCSSISRQRAKQLEPLSHRLAPPFEATESRGKLSLQWNTSALHSCSSTELVEPI